MINPVKADKIISGILESPNESKNVEFKPSIPWPKNIDDLQNNNKIQEVIKSILAMSNILDGGKIILGIEKDNEEGKYILRGMEIDDLNSYDQDLIFDHVRNFGEPEPRFQILNIEFDNKNFIVFAIQSFIFAPIICHNHRNLSQLENTCFYIRTDKPETKKVTEPSEMREIVDLAIEKELDLFSARMQRFFRTMSSTKILKSTGDDYNKFQDELKDVK
jgi:predicted HTH transcriptional regulator